MTPETVPVVKWQELLAERPPYRRYRVQVEQDGSNRVRFPEVLLYCSTCKLTMRFESRSTFHPATESGLLPLKWVQFGCKQCETEVHGFALRVELEYPQWFITKVGQVPVFGPQTPARLVSLIGPEDDLFFKGRRCESQDLGIGAFVYYRRVIESLRDRLLDGIIKVIEHTKPDAERVERLTKAKAETQFTKSMEIAEDALPDSLFIGQLNPLKVLHSVYSKGLHNLSDEECLALASTGREVLAALAERMAEVTRDHASLIAAANKLNSRAGS